MHPLASSLIELLLLTLASGVGGFILGRRARARAPSASIGQRVVWLKSTSKGNYRPVQAVVRSNCGAFLCVEALDSSERAWVSSAKLLRR